ncbi:hypothetical protein Pst134EA_004630 [Puccinia striiformis f. sp. tritici]|uniref:uncharacterized protein n=1 Tax=Puccinia striiformis f. sp. tritici TaxID=168172 RepID=UPI0020073D47|nr:uncharacterized protein Pst134EA_032547 [Puccinia striiformis f. sp. tritici]XP_047810162.1 hypothetical protein Pst134EA_004630 [Puccinia striiformis f. sp. tritici]KAI9613367.1 hypothetical protein H4Q26_009967 [Puccinia striiformis f. sp. tritici PST-130]KAH9443600.1 hypothetical protein Pst134EA_032547 [Puccinia striiformis f. sp. tritici]KAH9461778.1 hypothetical protein Pst134EB_005699 [Puccinia striiformis f. sp. tritici]KAH9470708.1 hypothetical protein Pst134EA_004630 [Puccinia str
MNQKKYSTYRAFATFVAITILNLSSFQGVEIVQAKPQRCSKAVYATYEGDPDIDCVTRNGVSHSCQVKNCYTLDGNKKLPYKDFNFVNCHRFADEGEGVPDATDQTIHPNTFIIGRDGKLNGLGTQPGIKGQQYFECPTSPNGVNNKRPWCEFCSKPKEYKPIDPGHGSDDPGHGRPGHGRPGRGGLDK